MSSSHSEDLHGHLKPLGAAQYARREGAVSGLGGAGKDQRRATLNRLRLLCLCAGSEPVCASPGFSLSRDISGIASDALSMFSHGSCQPRSCAARRRSFALHLPGSIRRFAGFQQTLQARQDRRPAGAAAGQDRLGHVPGMGFRHGQPFFAASLGSFRRSRR